MRRLLHLATVLDTLLTLWWLAQGAPTPSLGALTAPAPGWLVTVALVLCAGVVAVAVAAVVVCVQAVRQPRG